FRFHRSPGVHARAAAAPDWDRAAPKIEKPGIAGLRLHRQVHQIGSAYGIRTRVTGVRGRRPGPLDECATCPSRLPWTGEGYHRGFARFNPWTAREISTARGTLR